MNKSWKRLDEAVDTIKGAAKSLATWGFEAIYPNNRCDIKRWAQEIIDACETIDEIERTDEPAFKAKIKDKERRVKEFYNDLHLQKAISETEEDNDEMYL